MSALNLRLPDSLHDQVRVLTNQDNVSMNQFIALAVAEKVSALMTLDYLEQRASRDSREKFDAVLEKIHAAAAPPDDADRLPLDATRRIGQSSRSGLTSGRAKAPAPPARNAVCAVGR